MKNFKVEDSEAAAGGAVRRVIEIQQGIPIEAAKEIVKFLKEQGKVPDVLADYSPYVTAEFAKAAAATN